MMWLLRCAVQEVVSIAGNPGYNHLIGKPQNGLVGLGNSMSAGRRETCPYRVTFREWP